MSCSARILRKNQAILLMIVAIRGMLGKMSVESINFQICYKSHKKAKYAQKEVVGVPFP